MGLGSIVGSCRHFSSPLPSAAVAPTSQDLLFHQDHRDILEYLSICSICSRTYNNQFWGQKDQLELLVSAFESD